MALHYQCEGYTFRADAQTLSLLNAHLRARKHAPLDKIHLRWHGAA